MFNLALFFINLALFEKRKKVEIEKGNKQEKRGKRTDRKYTEMTHIMIVEKKTEEENFYGETFKQTIRKVCGEYQRF